MPPLVFLLGAGFNVDAKAAAGTIRDTYEREVKCRYPLTADLLRPCFAIDTLPPDKSIEDLFAEAQARQDFSPVRKMAETLMEADYYVADALFPRDGSRENVYSRFFDRFRGCRFLTFNYDSLPEIALLRRGRWHPRDGYGVPVEVDDVRRHGPASEPSEPSSPVLHLHGSLCVYAREIDLVAQSGDLIQWIQPRRVPEFLFDPDALGLVFAPFTRQTRAIGYSYVQFRVVAPVPDKAEGLEGVFVRRMYAQAAEWLRATDLLTVIGYSFSPVDRASYSPLIRALLQQGRKRILLVTPGAASTAERLSREHPEIEWRATSMGFAQWVESGFPG